MSIRHFKGLRWQAHAPALPHGAEGKRQTGGYGLWLA